MKFDKFFNDDSITVYVCIIALAIGYYALQSDFSFFEIGGSKRSASGSAIGKVSLVEADVRLRGSKNIFWANARRNDSIAQGDSLFVGPESTIVIQFEDGRSITIGSNSLVKFKTENKKVKLNLQYGSIKTQNLPAQLVVDDCGKALDIQSSNADFEIGKSSECGKIQVKTKKGEVKVNNKVVTKHKELVVVPPPKIKLIEKPVINEAIAKLESLQATEIAKINAMKAEELQKKLEAEARPLPPPELVQPKLRVLLGKEDPAAAWLKVERAREYILETSDTPEFTNPQVIRTPASLQKIENVQGNQVYYRLKTIGTNNTTSVDYSKTGQIELVYPAIKPNSNKLVYDYVAKNSQDTPKPKDFILRWNEIPHAEKYVVEVDEDSTFANPKQYTVRKPASAVQIPTQGKYNFRISAYSAGDRKISSTNKLGEIFYNRIFDMKTPTIEKTASSLQFFFQKGMGKYIWLKWNGEQKTDDSYRVEISKDQNFTKLFKSYSTKKNKVLVQESLPEGQYYWRVRSESGANQVSDWSKLGYIEINSGAL